MSVFSSQSQVTEEAGTTIQPAVCQKYGSTLDNGFPAPYYRNVSYHPGRNVCQEQFLLFSCNFNDLGDCWLLIQSQRTAMSVVSRPRVSWSIAPQAIRFLLLCARGTDWNRWVYLLTISKGMAGKTPRDTFLGSWVGLPSWLLPAHSVKTSTMRLSAMPDFASSRSAFRVSVTTPGE